MTWLRKGFRRRTRLSKGELLKGLTLSVALLGAYLAGQPARAQEPLTSNSYEIQLGNFNMTSGEKSGGGYTVTDTVGQTAAGEFNSTGYNVYAGFQYMYTLTQFTFEIDDLTIDLGELIAGTFTTDSHTLKISTRSGGYTITAAAKHPLQTLGATAQIPFTSCDSGCSIASATPWTNANNIGFGFSAVGANVTGDFVNNTYFRPFADVSNAETPQTIASATTVVRDDITTITYKGTISDGAAAGHYETSIIYNALPSY